MTATQESRKGELEFTAHPIVDALIKPLPFETQMAWLRRPGGQEELIEYWENHEGMVNDAADDPLVKGFELGNWADLRAMFKEKEETFALGGNGSSKTEAGAKLAVEILCSDQRRKVLCISQNDTTSKQNQQPAIYKYLPASYRNYNERSASKRRGSITKLNYTQAGGFTESTFVLPNGSQCWFKTVEQFERDANSFEGPEYDMIWADEPIPLELRETLSYRVGKRGGKFLFTFTAVHGFDAICATILEGAKVVKSLPMNWTWLITRELVENKGVVTGELHTRGSADTRITVPELKLSDVQIKDLPAGHMPYIMQPINPAQGIIFLWTHWNLFLPKSNRDPNVPAVFDKCLRKSKDVVRTRLFGWTEKRSGSQFPNFNTNVHVVPHSRVEEMLKKMEITAYQSADPATARSYFLLWAGVDRTGRKFIFDESPRFEEGPWVGEDGRAGDGQLVYAGRGSKFYKAYMRLREQEHRTTPLRRFGDPRAFATQAAARDGGIDLFALFQEAGADDEPELAPMFFEAAKVMRSLMAEATSGSLEKINDAFAYDTDKPISVENEPKLYISDRCVNLIKALLNWSPEQGEKSPWKDPIDTLRYLFGEELYYCDPLVPEIVGGRGWGGRKR